MQLRSLPLRSLVSTLPLVRDARLLRLMASTSDIAASGVQFNGEPVKITAEAHIDVERALGADTFKTWLSGLDKSMKLHSVHFQSLDAFGPNVGFLKFKADVEIEGKRVPGIVFMRGGSIAILPILKCGTNRHVLFTVQPRVAIGALNFIELPAGMLDGDGHFAGAAAREMVEETGLDIKSTDLVDLTEIVYGTDCRHGLFPSPGACDEFMRVFLYEKEVDEATLTGLQGKLTGLREEGELIALQVTPYEKAWKATHDMKALSALHLYEKLLASGDLSK